eukprot:10502548-Lingulodinium_polyedra.AAC.1
MDEVRDGLVVLAGMAGAAMDAAGEETPRYQPEPPPWHEAQPVAQAAAGFIEVESDEDMAVEDPY